MSIVQTINLNLIPNSGPILVKCDQYDAGEGRIVAKLYDGDTAYTPAAGATAIIQGKKPDGNGFMYDATLSGNTVTADLTNQMSVVAGRVFVQFVITESDNRTGTFVFFLDVQPSALPADTEMSTSEYQVIEELLETAQAINENFPYIGPNGHWFYYDVEQGQYVDSGVAAGTSITIGTTTTLDAGDDATVTNTGDNINAVFNFGIPKGEKGDDGDPGATPDISMTATADAVSSDTPTVDVTKGGTAAAPTFALAFHGLKGTQGATGEEGPEGPAGNGIVSITKTGTSGLVDTYTILFTNGQTTTFTVTNGQDGTGSGDMTKAVYDSTNAVADAGGIAAYVAAHAATGDFVSLKGVTDISSWTELKTFNIGNYYYKGDASTKFSDAPTGIPSKNAMSLSMAVRRFDETTNKVFQELVLGYTSSSPDEKYLRKFFRVGNRGLNDVWSDWKEVAYTDDIPDITGKADKVSGATNGNLAGLDSNGNLTDSGYKPSDFATPSDIPDVTGKADKVSGATSGNFAGLDASGNLTDSGSKAADFAAAGAALPTGGTTGQALVKHSNTDYDTEWGDVLSLEQARDAEVVPGKNIAYSQENNAVIASIENGKSYKVRWTGSATVTLKKNSTSGTEITSGSISPLSFTADADYDLYFGSSADVTEIMVYDGASTDDTYEPYYVPVKDRLETEIVTLTTSSITGKGTLTSGEYCIKNGICYVYLAVTTTDTWSVGDANIVLNTNLPKRTAIYLCFGGVYGQAFVNAYSHADGRISFHIISGTIPTNTPLMTSLSFPIV